jgi:hypothetical protein
VISVSQKRSVSPRFRNSVAEFTVMCAATAGDRRYFRGLISCRLRGAMQHIYFGKLMLLLSLAGLTKLKEGAYSQARESVA